MRHLPVVLLAVGILLTSYGCGDNAKWNDGRAKAEVANLFHEWALLHWEVRLEETYNAEQHRLDGPPAPGLIQEDWEAVYIEKGVWEVRGADVGAWLVFEDGTTPVQVLGCDEGELPTDSYVRIPTFVRLITCEATSDG